MDAKPLLYKIAKAIKPSMKKTSNKSKRLKALEKENEAMLIAQIRARLALPMNKRTHFLRKRLPGGGSCL